MKNNNKIIEEDFNQHKYNRLIENANDYFEAAIRCHFDDSRKLNKYPLIIPYFTNRALACELYLKATIYLLKKEIPKMHNLRDLFFKLNEKDKKEIYNIWRTFAGTNLPDSDEIQTWFNDNLEANSNVFIKFRYTHEWAGNTISLESSLNEEQMRLHPLSGNRPFGSLRITDGFLNQFAKSIREYNLKLWKIKSWN